VSEVEASYFTNYDCIIDQFVVVAEVGEELLVTKRANV
jgi:hypothetical protein